MAARRSSRFVATLAATVAVLAVASRAEAHARLVDASPAANSSVAAPRTITLHFSETLVPRFSGATLMKADGSAVAATASAAPDDGKALTLTVGGQLAPGGYMVMWRAVAADDGHRSAGSFSFTVK